MTEICKFHMERTVFMAQHFSLHLCLPVTVCLYLSWFDLPNIFYSIMSLDMFTDQVVVCVVKVWLLFELFFSGSFIAVKINLP